MEPRGGRHPAWVQGARQGPLDPPERGARRPSGVPPPWLSLAGRDEPSSQVDRGGRPVHQVPPVALPRAAGRVTSGATSGAARVRVRRVQPQAAVPPSSRGSLSHGYLSALRTQVPSGRLGALSALGSSPWPLGGRAGLPGSRHRARGWVLSEAQARGPHVDPSPLHTGQFPAA